MSAEQLIESLNKLAKSTETYSKYTNEDLIREAFKSAGELSTIRSIDFGIEEAYPVDDKVVIEYPDVEIISEFEGHGNFLEAEILKVFIDGDKISLGV